MSAFRASVAVGFLVAAAWSSLPGAMRSAAAQVLGDGLGDVIWVQATGTLDDTGEEEYANEVTVCFAAGTSQEYINEVLARVEAINIAVLGPRYQLDVRWSGTAGDPRLLTWSFVPDGLSISGGAGEPASGSTLFSGMDAAFSGQGGRATWINRFQQVFDRWQAVSGLDYQRITVGGNDWDDNASWGSSGAAGARGDLRIAMHPIDGASGILAYNYFPGNGTGGNMVLDANDTGNWASTGNQNRFLRNTIAHEHGHGMGLRHVCPAIGTKLMEPFLNTNFDGPQHDDIRGSNRHYGDPYEISNTSGTAIDLGTLTSGVAVTPCTLPAPVSGVNDANTTRCSVDADAEADFFRFTVGSSGTVTIALTPAGETYEDCPQDSQCSAATCSTSTNSLTIGNVAVQLIGTNGTTVLAEASAGAAGVAETISSAALSAAGTYYVRIYESAAQTQSQLYGLTVTATLGGGCTSPAVSGQPANQTVCSGASTSFSVTATGTAPLTYQWRRGTTNVVNGGSISGATTATLTINPVAAGDAGTNYNCVVTNGCGNATSNNATLTVNTAPAITAQPPNRTVCAGASTTFPITATGAGLTYQWRRGTTNLVNGGNISGATSATLTINPVAAGDAGTNYNCVVSGTCTPPATSANATLTVNTAPAVTGQPGTQTVCSGASASFSVTASGTTPLTFQWRRGTTNLVNGGNISGATSATLTINPVGTGDAGTNYNCVVTNACGNATSNNATLTVNVAPAITGQPGNQTVCSGASAAFSVTATGAGLTYQWRRGTTNLVNGGNISGATSATLTINPVAAGDAATDYNCVVSGTCAPPATSANASLTVNIAPTITGPPLGNQSACTGASVSFAITATGTPSPAFQWRRGTTNLVNGGSISGATTATLTINPVAPGDAATNYNCVVTNLCGSSTSNNASLTVDTGPAITSQPGNVGACEGVSVSFIVAASGTPPLSYQWRRGTTNLVNGGNLSGATTTTLTINPVGAGDVATDYNCVVTNACGSTTSANASLTVNSGPAINGQPANQSACSGASASFAVTASGSGTLSYQWRRGATNLVNGGNLSGATSATLTINPVAPGDAATNYNCVVTNLCGSSTSNNAALTVDTGPAITSQPGSVGACEGVSVSFIVAASGTPPLAYQWRRGTTNLVNGGNLSGVTTTTLTINPVGAGDVASDYNCVVTNACGSTTSLNAGLTVGAGPAITGQPSNQAACSGASASFSVTASGSGTLSYQWRRGVANLVNGGPISGATSAALTINPVSAGDAAADYNCIVTNACGSTTSSDAALTLDAGPAITGQPANQTASVGDPASFTVTATGTPPLSYQWRRGTTNLTDGGSIGGATTATLTINPVALGDAGSDYNCVVSNACGSATSDNATLTVSDPQPCPGDLNGDNQVELSDLAIILANFGTVSGATYEQGDLDGDGDVELDDLAGLLALFGTTCP